ncbi:ECF-type sigma factor [Marinicella sediminis]|uniref:ECF-type sigma factor n=1 Tax=Marinicella sediminis TaxID=1792834 RepID=A0ABV7JEF5_9GAMM|nr:ECF-type sigma factor [Marinicella sediminis]
MGINEITVLLNQVTLGDKEVLNEVFARLYGEIRAIAGYQLKQLNPGQTITPTVLANECYLKLYQAQHIPIESKRHFLNCLSKSMRLYLIDVLRAKSSQKRQELGISHQLTDLVGAEDVSLKLIELDKWLNQIEQVDAVLAEVLHHKLIFNLTFSEMASAMDKSERQVMRLWKQAKALLLAMSEETSGA